MTLPSNSTVLIFCRRATVPVSKMLTFQIMVKGYAEQQMCQRSHSQTTHKVDADGRDVAFCICVVLRSKGKQLRLNATRGQQLLSTTDIWGLSALGCSDEQHPLAPTANRSSRQDLPTPESPISSSCNTAEVRTCKQGQTYGMVSPACRLTAKCCACRAATYTAMQPYLEQVVIIGVHAARTDWHDSRPLNQTDTDAWRVCRRGTPKA